MFAAFTTSYGWSQCKQTFSRKIFVPCTLFTIVFQGVSAMYFDEFAVDIDQFFKLSSARKKIMDLWRA